MNGHSDLSESSDDDELLSYFADSNHSNKDNVTTEEESGQSSGNIGKDAVSEDSNATVADCPDANETVKLEMLSRDVSQTKGAKIETSSKMVETNTETVNKEPTHSEQSCRAKTDTSEITDDYIHAISQASQSEKSVCAEMDACEDTYDEPPELEPQIPLESPNSISCQQYQDPLINTSFSVPNLDESPSQAKKSCKYIMLTEDDFLRLCAIKSVKLPETVATFQDVSKHFISPESSPVKMYRKPEVDKSILQGSKLLISHMEKDDKSVGNTCEQDTLTFRPEIASTPCSDYGLQSCNANNFSMGKSRPQEPDLADVEIMFVKLFDDGPNQLPSADYDENGVRNLSQSFGDPGRSTTVATSFGDSYLYQTSNSVFTEDIAKSYCPINATLSESVSSHGGTNSSFTESPINHLGQSTSVMFNQSGKASTNIVKHCEHLPTGMVSNLGQPSSDMLNQLGKSATGMVTHLEQSSEQMIVQDGLPSLYKTAVQPEIEKSVVNTHCEKSIALDVSSARKEEVKLGGKHAKSNLKKHVLTSNKKIDEDLSGVRSKEMATYGNGHRTENMSTSQTQFQVRFERKNNKLTRVVHVHETSLADESPDLNLNSKSQDKADINSTWATNKTHKSHQKAAVDQKLKISADEIEEDDDCVVQISEFNDGGDESSDGEELAEYFSGVKKKVLQTRDSRIIDITSEEKVGKELHTLSEQDSNIGDSQGGDTVKEDDHLEDSNEEPELSIVERTDRQLEVVKDKPVIRRNTPQKCVLKIKEVDEPVKIKRGKPRKPVNNDAQTLNSELELTSGSKQIVNTEVRSSSKLKVGINKEVIAKIFTGIKDKGIDTGVNLKFKTDSEILNNEESHKVKEKDADISKTPARDTVEQDCTSEATANESDADKDKQYMLSGKVLPKENSMTNSESDEASTAIIIKSRDSPPKIEQNMKQKRGSPQGKPLKIAEPVAKRPRNRPSSSVSNNLKTLSKSMTLRDKTGEKSKCTSNRITRQSDKNAVTLASEKRRCRQDKQTDSEPLKIKPFTKKMLRNRVELNIKTSKMAQPLGVLDDAKEKEKTVQRSSDTETSDTAIFKTSIGSEAETLRKQGEYAENTGSPSKLTATSSSTETDAEFLSDEECGSENRIRDSEDETHKGRLSEDESHKDILIIANDTIPEDNDSSFKVDDKSSVKKAKYGRKRKHLDSVDNEGFTAKRTKKKKVKKSSESTDFENEKTDEDDTTNRLYRKKPKPLSAYVFKRPTLMKTNENSWKNQLNDGKVFEFESLENRKPVDVKKLLRDVLQTSGAKEKRIDQPHKKKVKHKRKDHQSKHASESVSEVNDTLRSDSDDTVLSDSSCPAAYPAFKFEQDATSPVSIPTIFVPEIKTESSQKINTVAVELSRNKYVPVTELKSPHKINLLAEEQNSQTYVYFSAIKLESSQKIKSLKKEPSCPILETLDSASKAKSPQKINSPSLQQYCQNVSPVKQSKEPSVATLSPSLSQIKQSRELSSSTSSVGRNKQSKDLSVSTSTTCSNRPRVNDVMQSEELSVNISSPKRPRVGHVKQSEEPSVSTASPNRPRVSFNESVTKKGFTSPDLAHSPLKGCVMEASPQTHGEEADMTTSSSTSQITSPSKIPRQLQSSIEQLRAMLFKRVK